MSIRRAAFSRILLLLETTVPGDEQQAVAVPYCGSTGAMQPALLTRFDSERNAVYVDNV
jgi:hypothetical protein